jgi:hypothetical protein
MATTLAAFAAIRIVIAVFVRPHYMSPVTKVVSLAQGTSALPSGAWLLSNPAPIGRNQTLLTYQPPDRFWTFQGIETGIFLVFAAGAVALAYWMVISRDA